MTDPVTASQQPFLCFQRKAEGDILINSQKVAGSAQRRQHGVVLQHGSLLLSRSSHAPEIAGINELTGIKLDTQIWLQEWPQRLAQELGWNLENAFLGEKQEERASQIQEERFGSANWTKRR